MQYGVQLKCTVLSISRKEGTSLFKEVIIMTNAKTTKKALLFSALSMLLCVSMLLGTTYELPDNITVVK